MGQPSPDVIVIGGGVIGCAIAWELVQRKRSVTIVESGMIGMEASRASAGIIAYPLHTGTPEERVEITRQSIRAYDDLIPKLERETDISIDYRTLGMISIAKTPQEAESISRLGQWQRQRDFKVEPLDGQEARGIEPSLPNDVLCAEYAPGVGALSVHHLTRALAESTRIHGGVILEDSPVLSLESRGRTITGVRLPDSVVCAGTIVLAAGAWTRALGATAGVSLPTMPIKGQLVAFEPLTRGPEHIIANANGYAFPRSNGTAVVAATEEEVGFDQRVTGWGMRWLVDLADELCPGLSFSPVSDSWAGLRPGTPTREPIMGPVPGFDNLWVAAGHYRSGAMEAAGSAKIVASSIESGRLDPLLMPFLPAG